MVVLDLLLSKCFEIHVGELVDNRIDDSGGVGFVVELSRERVCRDVINSGGVS